jgi:DNA polymerase-3 subunit gamma/tau
VLINECRPLQIEDVFGQEICKRTLVNTVEAAASDNVPIPHTFIFYGPRGTGKTSMARILAMMLNCADGVTSKPCLQCSACTSILRQVAGDVHELDAASNRGIDAVRELRTTASFATLGNFRYKVFIIDEVQMLTTEAWNALLKTLEEPPARVIFVLCTTEVNKVPEAAFSRCLRMQCKKLTCEQIFCNMKNICDKKEIQYDDSALHVISKTARGGMRDALAELERAIIVAGKDRLTEEIACQVTGSFNSKVLTFMASSLYTGQMDTVLKLSNAVEQTGVSPTNLLDNLVQFLYAIYTFQILRDESALLHYQGEQKADIVQLAQAMNNVGLAEAIRFLSESYKVIPFNPNPKIYLDVAMHKAVQEYQRASKG